MNAWVKKSKKKQIDVTEDNTNGLTYLLLLHSLNLCQCVVGYMLIINIIIIIIIIIITTTTTTSCVLEHKMASEPS